MILLCTNVPNGSDPVPWSPPAGWLLGKHEAITVELVAWTLMCFTYGSFFLSPSENVQPIFSFKMCILQHYLTFQVLSFCKYCSLQGVHFEPKYCVLFSCRYHGFSWTSHSENFSTTLEKSLGFTYFVTKLNSLNKVFFYFSLPKLIIFACYLQIWISEHSK